MCNFRCSVLNWLMSLRLTGARRKAAYAGDDRQGCCTRLQVRHHRHRIGLVLLVASFFAHAGETQVAGDASAAAADAGRSVIIADPFPLELVWIPGGRFLMGDIQGIGQADERPVREATVAGFWMMRTEVTRAMFAAFAQATDHDGGKRCWVFENGWSEQSGISWRNPGFDQGDEHPVTCVNWYDARGFADWLASKTGKGFRLPTETEWEYAVRAGTDTTYYWGDDPAGLCANSNAADTRALEHYPGFAVNPCDDGFVRTSPVASFPPNPWGLHDIYGNVWEWVEDCWNSSYSGAPTDGSAWLAGDCARRGFRGGGYGDIPRFARSTLRNRSEATARKDDIGFRLVVGEPAPVTRRR